MRVLILTVLLPLQAQAWTFTPGPICRLSHATDMAEIELTFDPSAPLYSVTVTTPAPLPQAPFFSMRFIGPSGQTISTNRHAYGADGTSVTVTDTGFGNVLDGLQFNQSAEAIVGDTIIAFPLEGAAQQTAAFRACEAAAGV
ncbi:hypothetical protein C8N43_3609 [Litoreibacter ponti]|uniref:Excinuclease ABC subunit B n=1 Tax=Litoreibacter ponti TaxID=1510457 RepID=A0A2T6BFF3_9RHOB|nr:hypothetical protein [Litoreibacter ponti]PTX54788.1 hypothetical protein C8N43_3609 [Litoreibacter ponti]